ncbi:MAG: MbcA/ParS/Xre antitoxin family protein [Longimicrobiales bacterium]
MQRRAQPERVAAPADVAGAGLRGFVRIAELWGLGVADQLRLLGDPARSTYYKWKGEARPQLPRDTLERISYVVGIYKALQILFPDPDRADAWVRQPNAAPTFGGRSALQRMLSGQVADLYVVRQYVDAQLGGWPS